MPHSTSVDHVFMGVSLIWNPHKIIDTASFWCTWWWELGMGIPETALHLQELPHDDHSVIYLHSLTRPALTVIKITRGCGCLTNPKQLCVVSIVTPHVTKGRTDIFKFDASTHHLRSCSYIHRTLVLRAIDFGRPLIYLYFVWWWLNCFSQDFVNHVKLTDSQNWLEVFSKQKIQKSV